MQLCSIPRCPWSPSQWDMVKFHFPQSIPAPIQPPPRVSGSCYQMVVKHKREMAFDMLILSDGIDNFSPGSLTCYWLLSFCCILRGTPRRGIFESETVALEGIMFSHLLQSQILFIKKEYHDYGHTWRKRDKGRKKKWKGNANKYSQTSKRNQYWYQWMNWDTSSKYQEKGTQLWIFRQSR